MTAASASQLSLFDVGPGDSPRLDVERDDREAELALWRDRLNGMSRDQMATVLRDHASIDYETRLDAFRASVLDESDGPFCAGRWTSLRPQLPWAGQSIYARAWGHGDDWWREEPDLSALPDGYIAACSCGWLTATDHEYSAAIAYYDHALPDWRDLPLAPPSPGYGASKAKEKAWATRVIADVPAGWAGPYRNLCHACTVLGALDQADGVLTDHGSRGLHNEGLLGGAWLICACDCHADQNQDVRPGRCGFTGHTVTCGNVAVAQRWFHAEDAILTIDGGRAPFGTYSIGGMWNLCATCATANHLRCVIELEVGDEEFYGFHRARARTGNAPDDWNPPRISGGSFGRLGTRDPASWLLGSEFRPEFADTDQAWFLTAIRVECIAAGYDPQAVYAA